MHHSKWEADCFRFALEHYGIYADMEISGRVIPKVECGKNPGGDYYLILHHENGSVEDFLFDGKGTVCNHGRTLPGITEDPN